MANITDDVRADLERQISSLKREVGRLSKSLASQASDTMEDAEFTYDEMRKRAGDVARHVRHQAHEVTEAAREHPGTAATVSASIGLLAFAAGVVVGSMLSTNARSRHR
ncbi:hypothetical protein L1787_03900 [Acuticoccus sp. M5D2P5]|uniref:hypothetical protein n=1 Tax=Acuticoccus kalidii TaxID=2910977 RepID=UPI001F361C74|nr:hypothetical protein [Acuticoccus kalidii]MCF3932558.1 hypothetical protein [Acuticoccus kalidii]